MMRHASAPRSKLITQGVAARPTAHAARRRLRPTADFEKPIVGVANRPSTMNPATPAIQPLVDRAMAFARAAAREPQVVSAASIDLRPHPAWAPRR